MPPTKADYAKIAIACKDLGLDRHQLLSDRYQIESAKELTLWQLSDLYQHFRAQGWKPKQAKKSKLSPRYADAQHRKVVGMWITLHRAGFIKNGSDGALQAFVKRITGIDNLKWCGGPECVSLIEGLKSWGKRVGVYFD